ncbi:Lreu_0056 family protein [Companilactobacillus ginsenosidimutans]|uniref:Lreu_0056 family protein n=1 Tax=Companilactobacillus ginsenosidimutans TaxID=1007676 RepID=UPI00069ED905|nr:DUF4767 domain-containing protein [Companilactobacillus ginsenosidimutans]
MKFKNIRLLTVLAASLMLLVGCGNNNSASSNQNNSTSTSNTKSSSSFTNSSALWDDSKDQKLENFIDQWGPTMHQKYTKYDGKHGIDTSVGTTFPKDLKTATVNGKHASIGWSKSGEGDYEYNVVAIYNYVGTVPPLPSHITYFFAFKDGEPVALVDQSRQGGHASLLKTSNEKVKSSFVRIVEGKSVQGTSNANSSQKGSSVNNSSSKLATDPDKVGVMVYQEAFQLDSIDSDMHLYFGSGDGKYGIGGGTGISSTQFRIDGDIVHYWKLDPDSAEIAADETSKEYTIGLKTLEDKYYTTPAQKQGVQNAIDHFQRD